MKTSELYEMTNVELAKKITELKQELFMLRFKHAAKQLSNPLILASTKKDIARAKTILRQRELNLCDEPLQVEKKGGRLFGRRSKGKR
jgi:large subunit ribosomal protein L29